MRPKRRQSSVLDCFAPGKRETARQRLTRAKLCSRLAKRVRGRARKKLYHFKNANILTALKEFPEQIEIHVDHDRYFGLLSVRLKGSDDVRVHTHENWLDVV